jgi:hypothetical protein
MASDNIIEMKVFKGKPKKDLVYECDCGCQVFHLLENGLIRCYGCALISRNLTIVDDSSAVPEEIDE